MNVRRIMAVAQKESFHILRDMRSLVAAFALPLFLVVLFGFGVSFDLENIPLVIVDHERSQTSRALAERMGASGEFAIVKSVSTTTKAIHTFQSNNALAAMVIPIDYSKRILEGGTSAVQILLDGTSGTSAQSALGSTLGFFEFEAKQIGGSSSGMSSRGDSTQGYNIENAMQTRIIMQYNPGLRSAIFLVPGLFAYVLGIVAVLLTSLTVAKEWERGNMEQLFATPVTRLEIVIGKLLPYMLIGSLQALVVLVVGMTVFEVPLVGSPFLLAFAILLFLLAMLGQGLLISVVTRNQQVATQVSAVSTILPTLLLSGFLYPITNMPKILQFLSLLFPARYFIAIVRGIMLKGNGFEALWHQFLPLVAIAGIIIALARARFKRRIA